MNPNQRFPIEISLALHIHMMTRWVSFRKWTENEAEPSSVIAGLILSMLKWLWQFESLLKAILRIFHFEGAESEHFKALANAPMDNECGKI